MNYLEQYHTLIDVKPEYYKLEIPFLRPSYRRFIHNVDEFVEAVAEKKDGGGGGESKGEPRKIRCLLIEF